MARNLGKLKTILEKIVARLIDQIENATAANCYLSVNPDALPAPGPGGIVYIVSPTSGTFDEAYYEGGGREQLFAKGGIVVKIHSPLQLDQPGHDLAFLTHESQGIIDRATDVISALSDWSPEDASSNAQTRDPLYPHSYAFTRASKSLGGCEIVFNCNFDWDVS